MSSDRLRDAEMQQLRQSATKTRQQLLKAHGHRCRSNNSSFEEDPFLKFFYIYCADIIHIILHILFIFFFILKIHLRKNLASIQVELYVDVVRCQLYTVFFEVVKSTFGFRFMFDIETSPSWKFHPHVQRKSSINWVNKWMLADHCLAHIMTLIQCIPTYLLGAWHHFAGCKGLVRPTSARCQETGKDCVRTPTTELH